MSTATGPSSRIMTAPSVTKLGPEFVGRVLVCGSHGGVYAGYLAALAKVAAVILNDAGGGKDGAGYASLGYLDRIGLAAATVSHDSARIGDGADMLARGAISQVNAAAKALGCAAGQRASQAAALMSAAGPATGEPEPYEEARFLFSAEGESPQVWGVDSASLVRPEDAGQVVLTGSHGALLGGERQSAIKVDVRACAFNDAGVGVDGIGITRLPALDERGIAAVTVDCMSARIGDARSMWETGIVSHSNQTATGLGVSPGQTLKQFADAVRRG